MARLTSVRIAQETLGPAAARTHPPFPPSLRQVTAIDAVRRRNTCAASKPILPFATKLCPLNPAVAHIPRTRKTKRPIIIHNTRFPPKVNPKASPCHAASVSSASPLSPGHEAPCLKHAAQTLNFTGDPHVCCQHVSTTPTPHPPFAAPTYESVPRCAISIFFGADSSLRLEGQREGRGRAANAVRLGSFCATDRLRMSASMPSTQRTHRADVWALCISACGEEAAVWRSCLRCQKEIHRRRLVGIARRLAHSA